MRAGRAWHLALQAQFATYGIIFLPHPCCTAPLLYRTPAVSGPLELEVADNGAGLTDVTDALALFSSTKSGHGLATGQQNRKRVYLLAKRREAEAPRECPKP